MRLWFLWTLAASQLAGWKELRDDRGRTYYLNQRTGQTAGRLRHVHRVSTGHKR